MQAPCQLKRAQKNRFFPVGYRNPLGLHRRTGLPKKQAGCRAVGQTMHARCGLPSHDAHSCQWSWIDRCRSIYIFALIFAASLGAGCTGACPLKRLCFLAAAGLLGLAACTEYGYVKPGVTEEQFVQDSQDCGEIARHQAFRDFKIYDSRARHHRSFHHYRRREGSSFFGFGESSPAQLEFRYRRICMVSRGYELAPLEDESEGETPVSP